MVIIDCNQVAIVDAVIKHHSALLRPVARGRGIPSVMVGVPVAKHQKVPVRELKDSLQCFPREGMIRGAAACGWEVDVYDCYLRFVQFY